MICLRIKIFQSIIINNRENQLNWDTYYKNIRSQNPLIWPDVQVARLLARCKLPNNANVLDLGCGEGRNIRLLSEYDFNITGVDQSKHALAIVEKNYGLQSKNLICDDAVNSIVKLENQNFDFVLCWGLMHYISDTNSILNGIYNTLKNGGKTILSFNSNNEKRETVDSIEKYFSQKEVEHYMSLAKLKIIDIGLTETHFIKENKIESFYWVLAEKAECT